MKTFVLIMMLVCPLISGAAETYRILDKDYKTAGYIRGSRVYDKDWKVQYNLRGDRVYDKDWTRVGQIKKEGK